MALLLLPHYSRCSLPIHNHPSPIRRPLTSCRSTIDDDPPAPDIPQPKKSSSSGQGFGPKKNVIRRNPVERPAFLDKKDAEVGKEQAQAETAFLLTWLGLGVVILVQGLVLASSGFLPDKWDNFLVKYVYPSFTPTVALFVAGTVTYGVLKYFQNENAKTSK